MTELKTLKDIFDIQDEEGKVHYNMVKSEAVKWVKSEQIISVPKGMPINDIINIWIKYFFNLTKEDLEEKK